MIYACFHSYFHFFFTHKLFCTIFFSSFLHILDTVCVMIYIYIYIYIYNILVLYYITYLYFHFLLITFLHLFILNCQFDGFLCEMNWKKKSKKEAILSLIHLSVSVSLFIPVSVSFVPPYNHCCCFILIVFVSSFSPPPPPPHIVVTEL